MEIKGFYSSQTEARHWISTWLTPYVGCMVSLRRWTRPRMHIKWPLGQFDENLWITAQGDFLDHNKLFLNISSFILPIIGEWISLGFAVILPIIGLKYVSYFYWRHRFESFHSHYFKSCRASNYTENETMNKIIISQITHIINDCRFIYWRKRGFHDVNAQKYMCTSCY